MTEDRDVVIVGGGIAGLTAALRLRELGPLVLEADHRVGGRILSKQRGDLALSVGAHMFPPADSIVGKISDDLGLEVLPITGSMLNVYLRGKLVRDSRPELLPFRLPLSLGGRVSMARAGLKLKRDADQYMRLIAPRPGDTDAAVRLRALQHRGDETFADFLGPLHPQAFEIFRALANRSVSEPDEIAQSSMAALFGHVWDTGDLGRNMRGGSGRLPEGLGESLGETIRLRSRVREVRLEGPGVRIRYDSDSGEREVRARAAIVAIPAPLIPSLIDGLPPETADALAHVTYGPMVVLSILTSETEPMPWDDLYSILTPDLSFNMFFNHANWRQPTGASKQGSVLMVYAGGDRGRALLDLDDEAIERRFLDDVHRIYPQIRDLTVERMVKKWEHAGPFAAPGRWRHQAVLERGVDDRLFFAGDWVSEFVSMETAARTGEDAAANVRRVLGAEPAPAAALARDART
ncbi:MAG TPA: NAD(P)/FAD-dependent oxidoreductase [Gaiellaceae bacterium]